MKLYRPAILFALCAVVVSTHTSSASSTEGSVPSYSIEQFISTTTITGGVFSHDSRSVLYSSDAAGNYNVYAISASGGEPEQLTNSEGESYFIQSAFPHDDRLLIASDKGGNEQFHIFLRHSDGSLEDLTPGEGTRAFFYGWSTDETSFFYGSNERNPRSMDLYRMDIETCRSELVFENKDNYRFTPIFDPGNHFFAALSRHETYLALYKTNTNFDSDMYLYDFQNETLRHLSPHEGEVEHFPQGFDTTGRHLYYLTDKDEEFVYLMKYDIASGDVSIVQPSDWDIQSSFSSRTGKYRVVSTNTSAMLEINVYDSTTNQRLPISMPRQGVTSAVAFSQDDRMMTYLYSNSRSPGILYLYDFEQNRVRQLTNGLNSEIDETHLAEAQPVEFASFDGMQIPGLLYTPQTLTAGKPAPAVVFAHGGPGTQARRQYSAFLQFLVNRGYVVLDVNYRGSLGYGKSFASADDRRHGDVELSDCVAGKNFLVEQGLADKDRVGIFGGSYGGYITLACLAFRPEEFAAGVDLVGISNLHRMLESIPPMFERNRQALYREFGNPETDAEYLKSISPVYNADRITKPLLVLQGANDPRVPKIESDDIVEALRSRNVPVQYLVFEDEGHGFRKKSNRIRTYEVALEFLDKHVKHTLQ